VRCGWSPSRYGTAAALALSSLLLFGMLSLVNRCRRRGQRPAQQSIASSLPLSAAAAAAADWH